MTVVITSPTTQYSDLYFEMKITPTQNKIVYLSQQVEQNHLLAHLLTHLLTHVLIHLLTHSLTEKGQ
jgi:hypothetical protein